MASSFYFEYFVQVLITISLHFIKGTLSVSETVTTLPNLMEFGTGDTIRIDDMIIPRGPGKSSLVGYNWPDGVVPYVIDESVVKDPEMFANVVGAMSDISERTCIRFRPAVAGVDTYWAKYWVNPQETQCSAYIGWRDVPDQQINVNTWCPRGAITHEILHSLGLLHEQTRNDRDEYVVIKFENMYPQWAYNFLKDEELGYETSYFGVPYNYDSIMHYPANAFSMNYSDPEMVTIVTLDNPNGLGNPKTIGMLLKLTDGDADMINRKYNCTEIGNLTETTSETIISEETDENCTEAEETTSTYIPTITTTIPTKLTTARTTVVTTPSSSPTPTKPTLNPLCAFPLKPSFCV